jgi:hypothetical protein
MDAFPDRHREAVKDEARGRGAPVREVEAEAVQARAVVGECTRADRGAGSGRREIEAEIHAIRASEDGIAYFTAKAEEASRAAEAARAAAEQSCNALKAAWKDALSQWGQLRTAYKRRGEGEWAPRDVPWPGFQPPVGSGLGHTRPWPGGLRPDSTEAIVQFGGDAA